MNDAVMKSADERLRAILDTIQDGYYEVDLAGNLTFFNDALCRIAGHGRDELLGMNHQAYTNEENARHVYEAYNEVYRTGAPKEIVHWTLETRDGERRNVEASVSLIRDDAGEAIGFRGVVRDVTERKTAEAALRREAGHFRALVENITEAVTILNADGTVRYVSPTFEGITGYRPDEREGASAFERVHPDDVEEARREFRRLVARPGLTVSIQPKMRHTDGSWRTVELTGTNLLDDPAVQGIVVTYKDVTERIQLEEQLGRARRMEAVGQLAGGIAHDFNNHMTVVSGYGRMLLQATEADAARADLLEIIDAADRASALTQQLLAFSRRQVLRPKVVIVNELVREMQTMLRRLIDEHIELTLELAPDLGPTNADPSRLEQLIMNLVLNAQDAMPEGGRLTIETRNTELDGSYNERLPYHVEPGRYVALIMSDTGCGMDEDTRSKVFEPFFTTKEPGKGTGLGLSTVYGIVKQSGGYIWVDSEPGEGTTFRIYLPRVDADVTRASAEVPDGPAPGGFETILLAEDEDSVRRLLARVLREGGYTVVEAGNGREALEQAEDHSVMVDLVITDVVMPKMGGRELVQKLSVRRPDLPALFISGYSPDTANGQRGPWDDIEFIEKPIKPERFLRRVRQALDATGEGQG